MFNAVRLAIALSISPLFNDSRRIGFILINVVACVCCFGSNSLVAVCLDLLWHVLMDLTCSLGHSWQSRVDSYDNL
jgi:hypothetical protein